jgi:Protein of unknown function (DUF3159)
VSQPSISPSGGPANAVSDSTPSPSTRTRRVLGLPDPIERSVARATAERTLERVGGPVGLVSAVAPTIAFVATDLVAGLGPAIIALAVTAVAACAVRLVRRESPAAAVAGLAVAAVCAAVAALAGEARAFFLPSMVLPVLFVVAYTISLVTRRPLMGLIVNPLSGASRRWHINRPLRRLYTVSTLVGMVLAVVNLATRIVFYITDQPGALAVVQVAATSVFALHFAVTLVLARRIVGASGLATGTPLTTSS